MTQAKIDVEADAGRLLRDMAITEPIMVSLQDPTRLAAAMWLTLHDYAYWTIPPRTDRDGHDGTGSLRSTEKGRTYYAGLCENPAVTDNPAAWVDEARTGQKVGPGPLGTVTTRSPITRACIPKPSPPRTPRSPEDMVADMERDMAAQARWCAALDVTPDELRDLGREGRLRWCPACEDVGIFDRDRGGWKSKCRKCRKDGRRG